MKAHKGRICPLGRIDTYGYGIGYAYLCVFLDHPELHGKIGYTSYVVKDDCDLPRHSKDSYEIETYNSRYTVIPNYLAAERTA